MKKALLVGINYINDPQNRLYGCINDIVNTTDVLTKVYGYPQSNIINLRDDSNNAALYPTRENILSNLTRLIAESGTLSEIWFHYSGHGSQVKDTNGDEIDGLDEVLVPIDFRQKGFITDDEIFNIVKNSKCKTMLIFDCCHSGTICDLQWSFEYKNGPFLKTMNTNKILPNKNIVSISGCKDTQTSADAYDTDAKQGIGAFTYSLLHCLRENNYGIDILKLHRAICNYILSCGFTQIPMLSCSSVVPMYKFTKYVSSTTTIKTNTTSIIAGTTVTKEIENIPTEKVSIQLKKILDVVNEDKPITQGSDNYILLSNTNNRRKRPAFGKMAF
jgi:hypothetical protein